MVNYFLDQASTYAGDVDNLILLVTVLVGFWFFLAEGVFLYFVLRFRKKDGQRALYITGEEKHQTRWISIPHGLVLICDVFIIIGSIRVWYDVKQDLPDADYTIRVTGQQWAWTFQHPGADGELDTEDDIFTVDELHLEVDKTYHYKLGSRDVLHNFSVPVFRLKQDAIPGRTITGWFSPNTTGEFDIQCAEMCGIGHGIMAARLYIEGPEQHALWLAENTPSTATAALSR